jgi:hypothetical protein
LKIKPCWLQPVFFSRKSGMRDGIYDYSKKVTAMHDQAVVTGPGIDLREVRSVRAFEDRQSRRGTKSIGARRIPRERLIQSHPHDRS